MSAEQIVRLTVNGQPRALAVAPNTTLLSLLRDHLDLTGSKRACGTGDCGACTVQIDGEAASACLTLAVDVDGSEVTTVEGLAKGSDLHPLQKAFVTHGALQCGYCTAGALMSAKALIDAQPEPVARRHHGSIERQPVPLRRLPADGARDRALGRIRRHAPRHAAARRRRTRPDAGSPDGRARACRGTTAPTR